MAVECRSKKRPRAGMQIAPMIDVVFLMLIYFLVGATLDRQEADIAFQLPGNVEQAYPFDPPDEQIVEITAQGQVIINEYPCDSPESGQLSELTAMLSRFKQACDANKVDSVITIAPEDGAPHQIVVRVLDACSAAGITQIQFALSSDGF